MKGKGHQGEHGAVYHFGTYPEWTTPVITFQPIIYMV